MGGKATRAAGRKRSERREIELKLAIAPETAARLRRSRVLSRLSAGPSVRERLVSTYYDTPDLALRSLGATLRLRDENGVLVQCVKRDAQSRGGALSRAEDETVLPAPDAWPQPVADRSLRKALKQAKRKNALKPLFVIDVERASWRARGAGGADIEISLDTGEIQSANGIKRPQPLAELELELKSGDPTRLFACARELAAHYPLRVSMESKAEQGFRYASGASPRAVKAQSLKLDQKMSPLAALGAMTANAAAHFAANAPAVEEAHAPEGVHQMRVALRRFRAAATLYRRTLRNAPVGAAMAEIVREAKDLAALLGRARDCDVFAERALAPLTAAAPDEPSLPLLAERLAARRACAWRDILSELSSGRGARLTIEMSAISEQLRSQNSGDGASLKRFARRALSRYWRRAHRRGDDISALPVEERHAMRIDLKKLRYAASFFRSLFAEHRVKPFLKSMSRLQDAFGDMNDAAVAMALARDLCVPREGEARETMQFLSRAEALVTGSRLEADRAAVARCTEEWAQFKDMPPFWTK